VGVRGAWNEVETLETIIDARDASYWDAKIEKVVEPIREKERLTVRKEEIQGQIEGLETASRRETERVKRGKKYNLQDQTSSKIAFSRGTCWCEYEECKEKDIRYEACFSLLLENRGFGKNPCGKYNW
jgi:hypothetical protein